jgi:hypothetical protein
MSSSGKRSFTEAELRTLSAIYRFVLRCGEKKAAGEDGGEDDAKEDAHVRAEKILPR